MISETEVLENGEGKHRCQVVRWMRTFPFSFISRREYVIARRMWRGGDGALYGITKVKGPGRSAGKAFTAGELRHAVQEACWLKS